MTPAHVSAMATYVAAGNLSGYYGDQAHVTAIKQNLQMGIRDLGPYLPNSRDAYGTRHTTTRPAPCRLTTSKTTHNSNHLAHQPLRTRCHCLYNMPLPRRLRQFRTHLQIWRPPWKKPQSTPTQSNWIGF